MIISRRILYFLSRRSAVMSSRLISKMLSWNLLQIQKRSPQEINYAVTGGVQSITLGIIANCSSMISDASILLVLSIGLFVLDPLSAFATFALFAGVAYGLNFWNYHHVFVMGRLHLAIITTCIPWTFYYFECGIAEAKFRLRNLQFKRTKRTYRKSVSGICQSNTSIEMVGPRRFYEYHTRI